MRKARDPLTQQFYDYIAELVGKQGLRVLLEIAETDGVTDEVIEEKTRLKMARIRFLLNQLHKHGVIEYVREKNLSDGWFTYTWKFDLSRAMRNFFVAKKNELDALTQKLRDAEGAVFYKCRRGCLLLPFDVASDRRFRCPRCNSKLSFFDNKKELEEARKRATTIQKILENQSNYI